MGLRVIRTVSTIERKMEVKQEAFASTKITTKVKDEKKKTKNEHLNIIESLRQAKTNDDQFPKSSISSSSHVMKFKMGNQKNSIQRSENSKEMENHHMNNMVQEETNNVHKMKKVVWDCETTLYDSFELNSFNRQLDSTISSSARSISMPHLPPFPPPPLPSSTKKQSPNKISRSLQKLIKSIFKQKQSNIPASHGVDKDKYYVVFDNTGSLTTIPESSESMEVNSLVRKTVSNRIPSSRLVRTSCS